MAINLYSAFTNEISGETFRCISYTNAAFVFNWMVQPNGYIPFEHIHLSQEEVFHVMKGEIKILIDGQEYIGKPGDTITVPKGKKHIAVNNKPALLECVVEYKPGLDSYTFFQCFAGLTIDKDTDKKGQINIPKMLYFSKKMKAQCSTRPTSLPAPVLQLVTNMFYRIGNIAGWDKLYQKYTGEGN
jgi:quercetin dioxygenase-like cupin family protein